MKPAPFDYVRPESLDDALAALAEAGDEAKVLAGGQSLVPALNMRLLRPALLVDVNRVVGLDDVERGRRATDRRDRTRPTRCFTHIRCSRPSCLTSGTRSPGTAAPSADRSHMTPRPSPLALVTCGGSAIGASTRGREIPAEDLFLGPYTTRLRRTSSWSRPCGRSSPRAKDSPSTRSRSAAATTRSAWPRPAPEETTSASSSAPSPRADAARGRPERPGESAAEQVEPWGSIHASPEYLRHLVRVLVDRVVGRARERAA